MESANEHTTTGPPPSSAVAEVVQAARYYKADRPRLRLLDHPVTASTKKKIRFERLGLKIQVADPGVLLGLMKNTPEYPASRKILRGYQEDTSKRFREALVDTGRAQIILATGLGKTIVMADVVADLLRDELVDDNRVLVLAHTKEIVGQLHRAFWHQLPKWVPTHHLAEGEA